MKALVTFFLVGILWVGCSHNPVGPGLDVAPNTAKYRLSDVNSLAESYGKDLQLIGVVSQQARVDGTSDQWRYCYADTPVSRGTYCFHANASGVGFDHVSSVILGSGAIPNTWFNSDSALVIAEQNGGSQFRAQNPHYTIAAFLDAPTALGSEPYWYVTYQSTDSASNVFKLSIDAITGQAVQLYN